MFIFLFIPYLVGAIFSEKCQKFGFGEKYKVHGHIGELSIEGVGSSLHTMLENKIQCKN